MANPQQPQAPISAGTTMVNGQNMPLHPHPHPHRVVYFKIYCAPLDDRPANQPYHDVHGNDPKYYGVTKSASHLRWMPFVVVNVVNAETESVIYPPPPPNGHDDPAIILNRTQESALHDGHRYVHELPPIPVPDNVTQIALHIGNDAYKRNRKFKLFLWTVPDVAQSTVHIYEIRSDLQNAFKSRNSLPVVPPENELVVKNAATAEYYGFLNGDIWKEISHEFTDADITRLCPPETLSRNHLQSNAQSASGAAHPSTGSSSAQAPTQPQPTGAGAAHPSTAPTQTQVAGSVDTLHVDWLATLRQIYDLGKDLRSMIPLSVTLDGFNITLDFIYTAFANAINTSARTTVQQALRRTSPRTFAVLLRAAWKLHINRITLNSSWRPMLGSKLHKMGDALDVWHFDDDAENIHERIDNSEDYITHPPDDHPFPTNPKGQKLKNLYDEMKSDSQAKGADIYTPYENWKEYHDDHMHITVKDE